MRDTPEPRCGARCVQTPLRPLLLARVARHADASRVALCHRTHGPEVLQHEQALRDVLLKVCGAWRFMMLSEVPLPEETRCMGIAPAEPAPCRHAYMCHESAHEAHENDTSWQVCNQMLMEALSAYRLLRRPSLASWMHVRPSNAPGRLAVPCPSLLAMGSGQPGALLCVPRNLIETRHDLLL